MKIQHFVDHLQYLGTQWLLDPNATPLTWGQQCQAADLAEAAVFEAEAPLLLRLQPGTLRFWNF